LKIRFKLILIFICIILVASLPNSRFILNRQEDRKLALITHQGEMNSRILARAALNIILMNGGDISSATVDAREMISIMAPLAEDGLVYAESVLISSQERYSGIILARYIGKQVGRRADWPDRVSGEAVKELQRRIGFSETSFPGVEGTCYEFISTASPPGKPGLCIGRLVFSKAAVLEPVKKLRLLIYASIAAGVFLASLMGLFFSGYIVRPIRT
jgi:hypothetical protein